MRRVRARELPDNTQERINLLTGEQSAPDPEKPKLSEATEQKLADVETKSAETYAEIEEQTYRLHKLVKRIEIVGGKP